MMGFFRKLGPQSGEQYAAPHKLRDVAKAREQGKDAVFHGACIGCVWQSGNTVGEGLRYCMGCAFFDYNQTKPNRRINLPYSDAHFPEDY